MRIIKSHNKGYKKQKVLQAKHIITADKNDKTQPAEEKALLKQCLPHLNSPMVFEIATNHFQLSVHDLLTDINYYQK